MTLICLHAEDGTSRTFERILPQLAGDRSVYAPDLPGAGESDPAGDGNHQDVAVDAVSDLAADLRLRRIDVLGFRFGAATALRLAVAQPVLVRRVVLIDTPPLENLPLLGQESLVMRDMSGGLFAAAPRALVQQIDDFLKASETRQNRR